MMRIFKMLKVLLTSRHLFSNWLFAGVRYFLMKRGLVKEGSIAVKCRDRVYMLKPKTYGAIVYAYYRKAFEFLECSDSIYAVVSYGGGRYVFTTLLSFYMTLFMRILLVVLMMI
jgi:hypothetical protein